MARSSLRSLCAVLALASSLAGCSTLGQLAALSQVELSIDGVDRVVLAGVALDRARTLGDVSPRDLLRIADAVGRRYVPLEMSLLLAAENPASNAVEAHLVELEWTLLLDGQPTVSGTFLQDVGLPPGETSYLRIPMELDLYDVVQERADELVRLALGIAGVGSDPVEVSLRARPTITSPLGPIEYPRDIIVTR